MSLTDIEIIKKFKIKPSDRVLDIGGSMKQHTGIKIDTLVDIIEPEKVPYFATKLLAKKFVKVDITNEQLPFKNKEFDFCLCTHTLEDLTNPLVILNEIQRVAKRGYIATPSFGKDILYSHIDLTDWLTGARRLPGTGHHKWLFLKEGNKMKIIPKNYPILYTPRFHVTDWRGEEEFEYYWKDKLNYEIVSDIDMHALIAEYNRFFREHRDKITVGRVLFYLDNPFSVFKAYAKVLLKRGEGYTYIKK